MAKKSIKQRKITDKGVFAFLSITFLLLTIPVTVYFSEQQQQRESEASSNFTTTAGRPYTDASPFNAPIGTNVELDPNSAAYVNILKSSAPVADLYEFGTPIFFADANTPKYTINCTESWGTCALEGQQVPIPAEAQAAPGSDGQMVVVDLVARKSYDFWQYKNDHANTSWGGVISIDGPGYDTAGNSAVGAGLSRLVGIARNYEISQGVIDHALVFSTNACGTEHRAPATKSDGRVSGSGGVPEGIRVQLDPSVNCDTLAGAGSGEKAVCKAMQKYGAYNIDCGGSTMALQFENPIGKTDPYKAAGLSWDYFSLSHIPWEKMRVLKAWNSYTSVGQSSPTSVASPIPPTVAIATPTDSSNASDFEWPKPPANIWVTEALATAVKITWSAGSDNVGVTQYNIWRGDGNYANWVKIASVLSSTFGYTDTTVTAQKKYSYAVRSQDAAGNISWSSPTVQATTPKGGDTTVPTAATNLRSSSIQNTSVALAWKSATDNVGVSKYEIWRGDGGYSNWVLVGSVSGSTLQFINSGLQPKTQYTYGIRALDAVGNKSASSNTIRITTR